MFERFKPADEVFFRLFEEAADILFQGAELLREMMATHETLETRLEDLISLEQKGDKVTDKIIDKLNETFMTPLTVKTFTACPGNWTKFLTLYAAPLKKW